MSQAGPAASVQLRSGAATDAGRVRPHNEDSYLAAAPLFLVADGMGGHRGGAAASELVVRSFEPLAGREWVTPADLHGAVSTAAAAVETLAGEGAAPGSTLAGVAVTQADDRACWLVFNVGDSRVYLLREGSLEQVSVDHSRRQELLEAGEPPESIMVGRNVITRALGGGTRGVPVLDQWLLPAERGDRLLICSDGLSTEVTRVLLSAILQSRPDPQDAARALVEAALEAGGRDNITAIVLDAVDVTGGLAGDDEDTLPPGTLPPIADDDTLEQGTVLPAHERTRP